jgi:hypothetical protein
MHLREIKNYVLHQLKRNNRMVLYLELFPLLDRRPPTHAASSCSLAVLEPIRQDRA